MLYGLVCVCGGVPVGINSFIKEIIRFGENVNLIEIYRVLANEGVDIYKM